MSFPHIVVRRATRAERRHIPHLPLQRPYLLEVNGKRKFVGSQEACLLYQRGIREGWDMLLNAQALKAKAEA